MKKPLLIVLTLAMLLSLCACGGSNDTTAKNDTASANTNTSVEIEPQNTKVSKEDLLSEAIPLTEEEADKIFENAAYANSLVSNTYTFTGKVFDIKIDYLDVMLSLISEETGKAHTYGHSGLSLHLYLPTEELINIELGDDILSFVGRISAVEATNETDITSGLVIPGTTIIMEDAYIVE